MLTFVLALAGGAAPTPSAAPSPTPSLPWTEAIPRLVVALESWQGASRERTALFDDGTLVRVSSYRGIDVTERRRVAPEEIEVIRRVCQEALGIERREVEDPSRRVLADTAGRRMRLEVADAGGHVAVWVYDDLESLPLALGRARGAVESLRARFEKEDLAELSWDTSPVKAGTLLKKRADGIWYRVVHDDTLDHDFELEELVQRGEQGSHKLRLFVYRGDLPRMFENPANAGPGPTPAPPARR